MAFALTAFVLQHFSKKYVLIVAVLTTFVLATIVVTVYVLKDICS